MKTRALALGMAAVLTLGACNKSGDAGDQRKDAQTPQAQKAAGDKTIAAALAGDSQFASAAKAAGLDQTLAGPGPYTVFVPDDSAFASAPAGTVDASPANRSRLTGILTNLILPGTVLVSDIDKAIEAGKGKGTLATMGGGALTATREGGNIVLTDASGRKATITRGDDQFSNGVVHHINALPLPGNTSNAPAAGQKAG
ncbi:MAG TPA: fasciclin domain-containing protein [Sphingomicrobium sp.]|nr:fasciclin domain-containing protein [Sphingomicrobium sp.]